MKSLVIPMFALGALTAASAQINSVKIHERVFNDDPSSTLVTTSNYPTLVEFNDSNLSGGGFANRHVFNFSADGGATDFNYTNDTFFDVKMDVSLTGLAGSVKEAGFLIDTVGGQGQFIVKTNGEIAAFGGPLPFHSFAPVGSVVPATITLGIKYFLDGGVRKITYTAGADTFTDVFTNNEHGIIGGTVGGYAQFPLISGNGQNFGDAKFSNFKYAAVPEPTSLAALGLGALALLRRRRKA